MFRREVDALLALLALLIPLLLASACVAPVAPSPSPTPPAAVSLLVEIDGETREITTSATTVGEALTEAGITLQPTDEVTPPLASALPSADASTTLLVSIVRVTESIEVIPESVPFERRIVRSADMSPEDPPRLLQTGSPGLQEVSVRIVFHDGIEVERWPTAVRVIEPPVDEVIMLGVSSRQDEMAFRGRLAYIDDGRAIVLEGSTNAPRQLAVEGALDGRVFQLSPDGRFLLYSAVPPESAGQSFANSLWVIGTEPEAVARPLQIDNVLWAAWDPAAVDAPRIAYTTARSVALPPGWEAINDIWVFALPAGDATAAPVRILESSPASFGWWGGAYAWSPDGARLAYAFADEVGLLDVPPAEALETADSPLVETPARARLHAFAAYDTGADWAWLPALSWSADGRYLAFTDYSDEDERFDLWLADIATQGVTRLIEGAGMWSASQWSPAALLPAAQLATLRPVDPAAAEDGNYVLWVADADGSNDSRVYPPEGETGRFARAGQSLVWGPDGGQIAFIFEDALHVIDLATGELFQADNDDTASSHLTWAPYGAAAVAP